MLQHIMKIASDAANLQFNALDQVTRNVANINTSGYKNKTFEQYLRVDGEVEGVTRVDNEQGSILVTRRELDVAIEGNGYIPVTQSDGTIAYTRDGSFSRNSEGYLITHRGDLVGDGIQLPLNYDKLLINPDGKVQVKLPGETWPKDIAQLPLVNFANPAGLTDIGYNKLVASDQSGPAQLIQNHTQIKQGSLERANVNVFYEIDRVLRLNASVLTNMRIVRFADDVYRQAVNLRQ